LPSATEIVGHLGLTDSLVGVSEEGDWPDGVDRLPVVTASRVDPAELTSLQIDAAVRTALQDGSSLYTLDETLVAELAPEVILTQDLCTVCAVSGDEVATLCPVGAEVISLNPTTLEGIAESVETLAQRSGVREAGRGGGTGGAGGGRVALPHPAPPGGDRGVWRDAGAGAGRRRARSGGRKRDARA